MCRQCCETGPETVKSLLKLLMKIWYSNTAVGYGGYVTRRVKWDSQTAQCPLVDGVLDKVRALTARMVSWTQLGWLSTFSRGAPGSSPTGGMGVRGLRRKRKRKYYFFEDFRWFEKSQRQRGLSSILVFGVSVETVAQNWRQIVGTTDEKGKHHREFSCLFCQGRELVRVPSSLSACTAQSQASRCWGQN